MTRALPARLWSEMLAFLADAKDRHEDNAPRLILADWLEEHGDESLAARGELIRLQCWAPFAEASRARQNALIDRHLHSWLGPLWPTLTGWTCQRGFFHVRVRADLLFALEEPAVADDFVWIDGLSIDRLDRLHVDTLVAAPWLSWMTALDLNQLQIGSRAVAALAGSPSVHRLRELYLRHNDVGPSGAEALARSPHLGRLRILSLAHNHIGPAGAAALAASPLLSHLHQLCLTGNGIPPASLANLQASAPHVWVQA